MKFFSNKTFLFDPIYFILMFLFSFSLQMALVKKRKHEEFKSIIMTRSKAAKKNECKASDPDPGDPSEPLEPAKHESFKCGHAAFLYIANVFVLNTHSILDHMQKLLNESSKINGLTYPCQLHRALLSVLDKEISSNRVCVSYYRWITDAPGIDLNEQAELALALGEQKEDHKEENEEKKQALEQIKHAISEIKDDIDSENQPVIRNRLTCTQLADLLSGESKCLILLLIDLRFLPDIPTWKKKMKIRIGHYIVLENYDERSDNFVYYDNAGWHTLTFQQMRYLRRETERSRSCIDVIIVQKIKRERKQKNQKEQNNIIVPMDTSS
jgi:hypothetical protein